MPLEPFGVLADGKQVDLVTLGNARGSRIGIITYGATINSWLTADRDGTFADIVLGFRTLEEYVAHSAYFGATIGRYANRIAHGRLVIGDRTIVLTRNDGRHHLHGGVRGLDKLVWEIASIGDGGVTLHTASPDGDQGYPGALDVSVTYTLLDDDSLSIAYDATADAVTPVGMTHHSYFNLKGEGRGDILEHRLIIHAAAYTPVTGELIPTGIIAPVQSTPLDFRRETPIGLRIDAAHEQLRCGRGYDHNFVLARTEEGLLPAASVWEPTTGRTLTVATTEPGLQFYSGNFLDGTYRGKSGEYYGRHAGFCLEPQRFPDAPNQPTFPNALLRPGERYTARSAFRVGVRGSDTRERPF